MATVKGRNVRRQAAAPAKVADLNAAAPDLHIPAVLLADPAAEHVPHAEPVETRNAGPAPVPSAPSTKDTIMDATTTADTMFADAGDRAKTGLAKGQAMFADMTDFGKGNLEALVESSKIAAKGFETLGKDAAAFVKGQFEDAQAQARTLASVSSPTEFMKLQGDFARTAFDKMIAETSRGTEAMLKLVGEVAQPISNRVALAADKIKVAA